MKVSTVSITKRADSREENENSDLYFMEWFSTWENKDKVNPLAASRHK